MTFQNKGKTSSCVKDVVWDEEPDRVGVSQTLSQPVYLKGVKSRTPPSALLLQSLCTLFFQMKSKNMSLTRVVVGSLSRMYEARQAFCFREKNSARTDKSL